MILKMLSGRGRGRVCLEESDLSAVAGRVPEAHVSPSSLYWFGFDDMTTTRPKKDGLFDDQAWRQGNLRAREAVQDASPALPRPSWSSTVGSPHSHRRDLVATHWGVFVMAISSVPRGTSGSQKSCLPDVLKDP